ncbi:MAG TPA: response regulator transcription factor [Solirubrobacteraceae bacterium]|nr:response regulator transcription factor [Solirubrobacteraceae bacterium]
MRSDHACRPVDTRRTDELALDEALVSRREITVLVADDHPLFLEATVRILHEHAATALVGRASDGRAALRAILALRPDVAVVDLELPGLSGLEVIEAIQREHVATRTIVLSAYMDGPRIHRAISAGARAYLGKASPAARLVEVIERVHAGATVLPSEVQGMLAEQIRHRSADRPVLSARQRQILELAADGTSTPAIAGQLGARVTTIKSELQAIYNTLEVGDRAAAVAQAIRHQLL